MRAQWFKLAARFDAMTLRERALVGVSLVAATVYLYGTLVIAPINAHKRALERDLTDTHSALQALESALKAPVPGTDPEAARRAYREALRMQLQALDAQVRGLQKSLVPPDQMARLLEAVLARNSNLQLIELHKLPARPLETQKAAATPAKGASPVPSTTAARQARTDAAVPARTIYEHTFEIRLEGTYAELHAYLAQLEQLPWQMYWGALTVDATAYPRLTATLTVHTLSLDKAWLVV